MFYTYVMMFLMGLAVFIIHLIDKTFHMAYAKRFQPTLCLLVITIVTTSAILGLYLSGRPLHLFGLNALTTHVSMYLLFYYVCIPLILATGILFLVAILRPKGEIVIRYDDESHYK